MERAENPRSKGSNKGIWKNNMHNNNHKRQETQIIFLREPIKEKPCNFLGDRLSTNGSMKTKRQKKWSPTAVLSLTCVSTYSLTHAPQLSECVCV